MGDSTNRFSAEEDSKLVKWVWEYGISFSECGRRLNRTKNACVSRWHRLVERGEAYALSRTEVRRRRGWLSTSARR